MNTAESRCLDPSSVSLDEGLLSLVNNVVFPPVVAVLLIVIWGGFFVVLNARRRTWGYRVAALHGPTETQDRATIARQFGVPDEESAKATVELGKARSALLDELHRIAISEQNRYQGMIAFAYATLGLGFLALAAGTTFLSGVVCAKAVVSWLDLEALIVFVLMFLAAMRAKTRWIKLRVVNEMGRQFIETASILPKDTTSVERTDITSEFEREVEGIQRALDRVPAGNGRRRDHLVEIRRAVEEYWERKRLLIETATISIRSVDLIRYLHRRPVRQYIWFTNSHCRLSDVQERRAYLLSALFVIAMVAALAKVLLFYLHVNDHGYPGFALLFCSGAAAVYSAYYFGTNTRSLMHRYRAQREWIAEWLKEFIVEHRESLESDASLPQTKSAGALFRIAKFEELMVSELLDWVGITSRDVIELGP